MLLAFNLLVCKAFLLLLEQAISEAPLSNQGKDDINRVIIEIAAGTMDGHEQRVFIRRST